MFQGAQSRLSGVRRKNKRLPVAASQRRISKVPCSRSTLRQMEKETLVKLSSVEEAPDKRLHYERRPNMLLQVENPLLHSHRQRETTGIKKLYNSFFVLF